MHRNLTIPISLLVFFLAAAVIIGVGSAKKADPPASPPPAFNMTPFLTPQMQNVSDDKETIVIFNPNPYRPNPYKYLNISEQEKIAIACTVYYESRGEPFDGQVAVALVVLNRYLHGAFGGSITDILYAPNQFTNGSTYTQTQLDAVNAALDGHEALDLNTDVVFFSTGGLKYGSYFKTIGGHVFRTYH